MAQAIQEQIGGNHCWGCGPLNPHGLQIHSYWDGQESICTFTPHPEHMAGPTHIVNGGILATLIDCHCVCTAIAALADAEGVVLADTTDLWAATASLQVDYLRPTPIGQMLTLRATVAQIEGRRITVACSISAEGVETARGVVLAVRVTQQWRESSPSLA